MWETLLNPTCETVLGTCGPVLGNFKENTLILYGRKVAAADFYIFVLSFVDTLHMDNLFVMASEHSAAVGDFPSKFVKKILIAALNYFFYFIKECMSQDLQLFSALFFLFGWTCMNLFTLLFQGRPTYLYSAGFWAILNLVHRSSFNPPLMWWLDLKKNVESQLVCLGWRSTNFIFACSILVEMLVFIHSLLLKNPNTWTDPFDCIPSVRCWSNERHLRLSKL